MSSRDISKTILAIMLMAAAACGFVMVFIITKQRLSSAGNSAALMIAADCILSLCFAADFICAATALIRKVPREVVKVRPAVQISVFAAIAGLLVLTVNGVLVNHLIAAAFAGVILPEAFFLLLGAVMARR